MEISGTTLINRPVETVYAYVMDVSNDANWRTGVDESGWNEGESLSSGAVGYTLAGNNKVEWRVVSYVEGESVDWDLISDPIKGHGGYHCEPVDGGTQFTLVAEVEPTGWLKLLGPIFGWMGRRQNQADVERLRELLESTPD